MTHIFIETPYRNGKLLKFLAEHLDAATRICIACDLTDPENEWVKTLSVGEWRKILASRQQDVNMDKRPAVFLMYAGSTEDVQQTKKKTKTP